MKVVNLTGFTVFTLCRLINQGLCRGLGGVGGTFWLHKKNADLQGSCSIAKPLHFIR